MSVRELQLGNESGDQKTKTEEGYYSMFHRVEEQIYGPESPLSPKDRVFRYLLHQELRWPEGHYLAGPKTRNEIAKATGLKDRQIRHAVEQLENGKFIESIQRKIAGVHEQTTYRLNPKRFSPLRVPRKEGLTVIDGGKSESPTPPGVCQNLSDPPSSKEGGPSDKNRQGVCQNLSYKTDLNPCNDSGIRPRKQITTKQIKHKQSKNPVCPENLSGQNQNGIAWDQAKAQILENYPQDEDRLDYAYRSISASGEYNKKPVNRPAGFILKGWAHIRETYSFVDDRKSPSRQEDLSSFDYANPEVAKSFLQKALSSLRSFG